MDFLIWHYSAGISAYLRRWYFAVAWVVHYFSLTILPFSLFSPWKRLILTDEHPGFSFQRWFEQTTFNLVSRGIGSVVRLFAFIAGILVFFTTFVAGFIGLFIWLVFPFIGLPYYYLGDSYTKRLISSLIKRLKISSQPTQTLFGSVPGRFFLTRINLDITNFPQIQKDFSINGLSDEPVGFAPIVGYFIDHHAWKEQDLRAKGVTFEDLLLTAHWWDDQYPVITEPEPLHFNRPGIGLELLFGYTPRLNQYSRDLSIPQPFSHHLIGREDLVKRIETVLTSDSNVILVGEPGVGKKTVVLEFARRAMSGQLGPKLTYKRVLEFDYNFILSEGLDINQKKAYLSQILTEAAAAGNVVLVIKDLHRLVYQGLEGLDFTDLFEQHLEKHKLKIIAISSSVDYERFLSGNSRIKKFFEIVDIVPCSDEQAMEVILDSAAVWEKERRLIFTIQSLRAILEGCEKYITETPFPEKALELLDRVVTFAEKQDKELILADDVNTVLAEITGISLARLTESEKNLLVNLEEILHKYLIGQDEAVKMISMSLRARSVGAKDEKRPVGSFLFLGPTGVGKTQTAKALAKVYYGDEKSIIRFDMAEYAGDEGLDRLIGNSSKNLPGSLTSAVKNKPASLLLLDEIEKSPPMIFNLFLSLLDEGLITDAFGKKIVCRHLFVIATSNAGSEHIRQLVSRGVEGSNLQTQVVDYIQKERLFSPEFINRFDGVVVFQPLKVEQLREISRLLLKDLQVSLKERNLYFEITDPLCDKLAGDGFSPEFGARPMRRIIDITLGDLIGKSILGGKLKEGDKFNIEVDSKGDYSLKIC